MAKIPLPTLEESQQLGQGARSIRQSLHPSLYFIGPEKESQISLQVTSSTAQRFLVEEIGLNWFSVNWTNPFHN